MIRRIVGRMSKLRFLILAAAAIPLAAASCSVALMSRRPAIVLGQEWSAAVPRAQAWAGSGSGRTFQVQDLGIDSQRIFPPLDSLLLADSYRRLGFDHPMLARHPAAPRKAGILCRENYIFYIRGNLLVGVEYRAVESDGWGGYRQSDEAIGEISDSPPLTA
jgi:hypothetical protein